ncbi:MAG: peptidylprolyl isomerase [bacterium]
MLKRYKSRIMAMLLTIFTIMFTSDYTNPDSRVIATVNGIAIKEDALTAEINKKLPLASYHARVSKQKLQEFRHQALQNLIEEELLYQEAKKQELTISQVELQQQIAWMKSGYPSEEAFQQALARTGLNILSLMERVERRLLIQKIQHQEINSRVTVTDSDVRNYFEANKTKFIMPKRFRVRHILVAVDPGAMAAGWQAGLKQTEQLYSRITAGEDFALLAREFTADSSSRELGGDLGWFHKGQLIPELEEALEEMQIGEVSKPVRSIYGFHILKFEEQQPEKQLTFDEINQEDLRKKLIRKRINIRRLEFLSNLKAKSDIRIFEQ